MKKITEIIDLEHAYKARRDELALMQSRALETLTQESQERIDALEKKLSEKEAIISEELAKQSSSDQKNSSSTQPKLDSKAAKAAILARLNQQ